MCSGVLHGSDKDEPSACAATGRTLEASATKTATKTATETPCHMKPRLWSMGAGKATETKGPCGYQKLGDWGRAGFSEVIKMS